MTSVSKFYAIAFKSTMAGETTTKTQTFPGSDEVTAKARFDSNAAKMLEYRGIKREFVSIEFLRNNKRYSIGQDFYNRTGLKPTQYEND